MGVWIDDQLTANAHLVASYEWFSDCADAAKLCMGTVREKIGERPLLSDGRIFENLIFDGLNVLSFVGIIGYFGLWVSLIKFLRH